MRKETLRIMIVDDHMLVQEGLKQLLEVNNDEFSVVYQINTGEKCLEKFEEINPDIILLDINLPQKNGIEVLKQIKTKNRKQKVLMLTIHDEAEYLKEALENGANGYILKESNFKALKDAILAVCNNEKYIEPSMKIKLRELEEKEKAHECIVEKLTKREKQIITLLSEGLFNKEIASNLNISEKTVKNHVANIFKKLGVADRTQAVVYAIKNNMITIK